MRAPLSAVLEALTCARPSEVTLDQIAEALGTAAVSPEEIGALIDALEASGVTIAAPAPGDLRADLARVLDAARTLRGELGRTPAGEEIARRAGLDAATMRRALLFARVLSR